MTKKATLFVVGFLFAFTTLKAQVWTQIGDNIFGESEGDQAGYSVSLNADGTIMAIGSPQNDDNGDRSGHTRVFQNQSGTWTQLGSNIPGEASGDRSGFSVSINANGTRLVIGAPFNDNNGSDAGHVRVYEYNGTNWVQLGSNINGESSSDNMGISVDMDDAGEKIVVGAYGDDGAAGNAGHARVYEYNGSEWVQLGADIDGLGFGDRAGKSVSISGNGQAVAVGSPENSDVAEDAGHVRVFYYNGTSWLQRGSAITGDAFRDYMGTSVSLAYDGYDVAVGAPGLDGNAAGYARVFQFQTTDWVQLGSDIAGEYFSGNCGYSVSLQSGSAGFVAVGEPNAFNGNDSYGRIGIYGYNAGDWVLSGDKIINEETNPNELGFSVSMAANSLKVANGGPNPWYVSGGAAIHELLYPPTITAQPVNQENICTGNDAVFLVNTTGATSFQWQIDKGSGFMDLSNGLTYGGVDSPELYITGVTLSMDNNQFRCIVSNSDGDVVSDTVLLTTDSEKPVITSTHNDQALNADNGCQAVLPDYTGSVTATDNCDVTLDITQDPAPGTAVSGATNTVTLAATDDGGNFSEVTFNVEVLDITDPLITSTHNNQTVDAGENCDALLPDYTGDVTATDNCDTSLDVSQSPSSGAIISGVTNEVTLTATDDAGNSTEVSFNVEVVDNTDPVITSTHNDTTVDADIDCQALLPDYTQNVVATDNCDANLVVAQSPPTGTIISGITNAVTLTVTDDAGNLAQITFNVEVVDVTDPVISSSHSDHTLNAGDNCQVALPDYTVDVIATDNCDADLAVSQSPAPGSTISGATNLITLTATDDAGNSAEVTFHVEVMDVTDPVITSTHNEQTVFASDNCQSALPDYTGDIIASDNCDPNPDITQNPAPGTLISGNTNEVTLTVTDDAGHFAEVSFNVLVIDNAPPVITSTHSNQTIDANDNCQAIIPDYTADVSATDNCDTDLDVTQTPAPGSTLFANVQQITLRATDDAGNFAEVSFDLERMDVTDPVITSIHDDQTIIAYNSCEATLPGYNVGVSATDNCDTDLDIVQNPAAGTLISGATNEVTITVTDDAGNSAEVRFNVAVEDGSSPEITSTHESQTIDAGDDCQAVLPDFTVDVMATDNCDTDPDITQTPAPGSMVSGLDNIIILTASDDAGNSSQVSFSVDVADNTDPVITCVEDQMRDVGDAEYYAVQGTEFDLVESSDNCQVFGIQNDFNFHSSLHGVHIPVGVTTIIWTVSDEAGNSASCSFDVTVESSVGIQDQASKGIAIYPNPAGNFLNIQSPDLKTNKLIISDITGKVIIRKNDMKQFETIDLSGVEQGVYVIHIYTDNELLTKKMVKE